MKEHAMLAELYKLVIRQGVSLRISGAGNTNDEEGFFDFKGNRIELFVPVARGWVDPKTAGQIARQSTNPIFELITLAHEYGHFISARRGDRSAEFNLVNSTQVGQWQLLNAHQKEVIWIEELIAWKNARYVLRGLGFDGWPTFNKAKIEAMAAYENRLHHTLNAVAIPAR